MTLIELKTSDQVLSIVTRPTIASGDQNTVGIKVRFDSAWDGYAKNATFSTATAPDVYEVILDDDACVVPFEVLTTPGTLYIGIRGIKANDGKVKTTTLVSYRIKEGAPIGTATAMPPTPDVYQQLLEKLGQIKGDPDKDGNDYILTPADKTEIAEEAAEKLQPKFDDIEKELAEQSEEIEDLKENSGGAKNVWYGTSDTASATFAKVVTTTTGDFKLETGNILYVKFANTVVLSVGYISLNVDGNGAKNCTNSGNSTSSYEWNAKDIIGFVWTGTAFERIDARKATTSYYGVVKLSTETDSTSTEAAATPSAVKQAYDLANTASSNASAALSRANIAQSMAGSAQSIADNAKTTADNANTAADSAQSMAGSAQSMAGSAQSMAGSAQSMAIKLNAESVKHTAQSLTDAQKAQARENIGAVSSEELSEAIDSLPQNEVLVNTVAENAAALIDTALLAIIGTGEVTV